MAESWTYLTYETRRPTYSEYKFIASKIKRLPMGLTEHEYNDLMNQGCGKAGPLAWANGIDWKMFSLMKPQIPASDWVSFRYFADLHSGCKQLLADKDKAEREVEKAKNELWGYEFTSINIINLTEADKSSNSQQPGIGVEVQRERSNQTSNDLFRQSLWDTQDRYQTTTFQPPHLYTSQSTHRPSGSRDVSNEPKTRQKRNYADLEDNEWYQSYYERKKPKDEVEATITALQEQIVELIRSNDGIQYELTMLSKSHTSLHEAHEILQQDHQELKEKHAALCSLLGVFDGPGQIETFKVKKEEED